MFPDLIHRGQRGLFPSACGEKQKSLPGCWLAIGSKGRLCKKTGNFHSGKLDNLNTRVFRHLAARLGGFPPLGGSRLAFSSVAAYYLGVDWVFDLFFWPPLPELDTRDRIATFGGELESTGCWKPWWRVVVGQKAT